MWTCLVCTLSNPNTLRYCDACNALNPYQLDDVTITIHRRELNVVFLFEKMDFHRNSELGETTS